jgi:Flp pilus assembly protein TadD
MPKYLPALILVGILAGEPSPVMAQAQLIMPENSQENSLTPSDQTESLSALIDSANKKIKKGEYQAARLDLNKAIELSPQNASLFALRGNVYVGLGRDERAIQDYDQAVQINPKNIIFYNLRGKAYERLGLYKSAVVNYSVRIQVRG